MKAMGKIWLAIALVLALGGCRFGSSATETNTTTEINASTGGEDNASAGQEDNDSSGQEDNGSIGGGDDNATVGGGDDNGTAGGQEDNATTGGGDDSNATTGQEDNGSVGDDDNASIGGGDDNGTTGGGDDNAAAAIRSLRLTVDAATLNKDHNTTLRVTARYDDNTTQDYTDSVRWLITPAGAVKITGHTLTALKDVNVTLRAKAGSQLSNPVTLSIYWEVNGHRLPPEPDPKINNATLLGVDVNHNGVRDDVERWIYETYKDKHPIYIDIAMQAARGYKLVLEHPEKAKEIHDEVRKARHCEYYYKYDATELGEKILIKNDFDRKYLRDNIYFNTIQRKRAYNTYDALLSGDSYALPSTQEEKKACDFNTSKYKE